MSEHIYLLTLGLPLATVLVVFGMKYWSAAHKAGAEAASADAYRELAASGGGPGRKCRRTGSDASHAGKHERPPGRGRNHAERGGLMLACLWQRDARHEGVMRINIYLLRLLYALMFFMLGQTT